MPNRRWLPAVIAPVLVAGVIVAPIAVAGATPSLPERSAAQILASVSNAGDIEGLTGSIEQHSDLGLPELPTSLGQTQARRGTQTDTQATQAGIGAAATGTLTTALNFLSADQRGRVSVGAAGARLQRYEADSEQDVIVNRGNIWLWDGAAQTVTHVKLPALTTAQERKLGAAIELLKPEALYQPTQLSTDFIRAIQSHTSVTVGPNRYVAGQAAYTLVFTPRERGTLVGSLQLQVDAKTGLPLQLSIYATGRTMPVYSIGYTSLRYGQPAATSFTFTPPPGAKVTTVDYGLPALERLYERSVKAAQQDRLETSPLGTVALLPAQLRTALTTTQRGLGDLTVTGEGWTSVIALPAGSAAKAGLTTTQLRTLTTALPNGDRLLSTALLNIVVRADGSIRAGSVPVATLTR